MSGILDGRSLPGPFAVIGDVHGCVHTLDALLVRLGGSLTTPVPGLTLVSVGDLHDKAGPSSGPLSGEPGSVEVLRWALRESAAGRLITVDSNHGVALYNFLSGARQPRRRPGLGAERTAQEILAAADAPELSSRVLGFLRDLPAAVRLSSSRGEFVVAHAAVSERLLTAPRLSDQERSFHVRASSFRWTGRQTVVVGHVTVPEPMVTRERRFDGTLAGPVVRIDTGADAGGMLTAFLPDSGEFVAVPVDERDMQRASARAADRPTVAA